jgi:hypothetical protein
MTFMIITTICAIFASIAANSAGMQPIRSFFAKWKQGEQAETQLVEFTLENGQEIQVEEKIEQVNGWKDVTVAENGEDKGYKLSSGDGSSSVDFTKTELALFNSSISENARNKLLNKLPPEDHGFRNYARIQA